MKRIMRRLLVFVTMALCACCLALAACGSDDSVTFEFETNGGAPIASITLEKGQTYTLPLPQRGEEYSFEGWYDNAEFTGSPVTEVVAETSATYYAKWEQMYEIQLDLDGGTLEGVGKIYAKAGAGIYSLVQNLVPVKQGWQFGEWYMNGAPLSRTAQMKAEKAELTARYMVGYTVHVYEQNTAQNDYVRAEDVVGYAYITGTPFTPNLERTGFALCTEGEHAPTPKVLSENMSENEFTLYYDRQMQRVTFLPNYPDETEGESIRRDVLYGTETVLPADQFSADGYFLYGWSVRCGGREEVIDSHYIDTLLVNGDGGAESDKATIEGETTFTALWSKGYTDMMKGVDRIFLFHEDGDVCYLARNGKYFKGTYFSDDRSVEFYDGSGDIIMQGRLKDDGTFIYALPSRQEMTADYYSIEGGINTNINLLFDMYDGLAYSDPQNGIYTDGTYMIDDENNYHVLFTSGNWQGQTRILRLLRTTVNNVTRTLFQFRNEEEYSMPALSRAIVDTRNATYSLSYYESYLSIDLDGYGTAQMQGETSVSTYYYTRVGNTLTILNDNGSTYGVCRIISVMNTRCYIPYTASMDVTYTAANGSTLKLDGMSEAIYHPAGEQATTGQYVLSQSVFGGYIVTMSVNGARLVFLTNTATEGEGDEAVTTYSFEKKPGGYAEYYYSDADGAYYSPFLVLDETTEGRASVYGVSGTSAQRVFRKVAEGAYVYNPQEKTYAFTVDKEHPIKYPEGISEEPIDLHDLDTVIFGLGSMRTTTSTRAVSYWLTVTRTAGHEPAADDYTTTYTGTYREGTDEQQTAQLKLVGGFALLRLGEGEWKVGAYSTRNGVTTVAIELTEGVPQFYVELQEGEDKTFVFLTGLIGTARERNADGTYNENVTFEFDGKGNGTLVTEQEEGEPTRVQGTVAAVEPEEVPGVEGTVYEFTPADGSGFRFILLISSDGALFTRETKDYVGTYTTGDATTLNLDGFGYRARYTLADTSVIEGVYAVVNENIIRVTAGNDRYFFDITDNAQKKFVVRGSEYGTYLFVTNYSFDGYTLELDGHFNATLRNTTNEDQEPITGTYTVENGMYELTLNINALSAGILAHYTGQLGYLRISSTQYNAFLVEYTDVRNIYVDRESWNVLTLDGYGNAVRYNEYGSGERGNYVLITDNLLYYFNSAGTDACIYRYNGTTGVIEKRDDLQDRGYYTATLDALLFSQYGFMDFNGETRYYYDTDEDGNVTIYRRAFGEAGANDYGFRAFSIGPFQEEMTFSDLGEGFGSETYYYADGYAITFHRAEDDKYDSEHYKYPVKLTESDENLYPIENLVFAPSGEESFTVTAIASINNGNYRGTVHREVIKEGEEITSTEIYFTINNFRFDLDLNYLGADAATYSIKQMRLINTYQSNMYLDTYILMMLMLGVEIRDTVGTLSFITEYNEDGTPGTAEQNKQYITSDFGADSALHEYKLDKAPYTYDEDTGIYTVVLPEKTAQSEAPDAHEYRVHIQLRPNNYFAMLNYRLIGYSILAYTRVETLETDEAETHYTVTAERIIDSETSGYRVGDYYSVTLETGRDDAKTPVADPDHLFMIGEKIYYVAYTRTGDEEQKITAAKYYIIAFTEDSEATEGGTVNLLKSVTVHAVEAKVYYTELGSYVEVLPGEGADGKDLIVHIYFSEDYIVTECTYNEAEQTFTVTTSTGRKLSVKITDESGKQVEITDISDPQS